MKLVDLKPRWFSEKGRSGQGVTFQCPCCIGKPQSVRLAIAFANPLDGGAPIPHFNQPGLDRTVEAIWGEGGAEPKGWRVVPPGTHWQRTGDTFENLSLSPSVDASRAGHWHGFVTNGEVA